MSLHQLLRVHVNQPAQIGLYVRQEGKDKAEEERREGRRDEGRDGERATNLPSP